MLSILPNYHCFGAVPSWKLMHIFQILCNLCWQKQWLLDVTASFAWLGEGQILYPLQRVTKHSFISHVLLNFLVLFWPVFLEIYFLQVGSGRNKCPHSFWEFSSCRWANAGNLKSGDCRWLSTFIEFYRYSVNSQFLRQVFVACHLSIIDPEARQLMQ